MPRKNEARQSWKVGRATVNKDQHMISQHEWERGCRMLAGLVLAGWTLVMLHEIAGCWGWC